MDSPLSGLSRNAIYSIRLLAGGPLFDGDLPSKQARTELIERGLARRTSRFIGGPYDGCQMNELTEAGLQIAMHMTSTNTRTH